MLKSHRFLIPTILKQSHCKGLVHWKIRRYSKAFTNTSLRNEQTQNINCNLEIGRMNSPNLYNEKALQSQH